MSFQINLLGDNTTFCANIHSENVFSVKDCARASQPTHEIRFSFFMSYLISPLKTRNFYVEKEVVETFKIQQLKFHTTTLRWVKPKRILFCYSKLQFSVFTQKEINDQI